MYKFLRYALVLSLAPTLALSQDKNQGPCPDVSVDLSGLSALSEIKLAKLENMESLTEQIEVAVFESLEHLEDLDEQISLYQAGDAATEIAAYDVEKRKTLDKTYKVSRADMLNIDNKFGKVHVNTWGRNEVHVKVDIIARAGSESKAQEILDKINVMESREGGTIAFRTNIEPMRVSGNNNKGYEVNYTISMPESNPLTVKNTFGDVYLASLNGKANINIKHGSLKCESLGNTSNNLKLTYASGSCGYINGGNLDVSYGDMRVDDAKDIKVVARYGDFRVGSLSEGMEMDFKHGAFRVDNISKNVRKIALDSNYSSVSLAFADNAAFNFDVNVQFGDFKYDKSLVNITSLEKSYTSAAYKGAYGGASPKGLVSVNSKYGDVKFTK